MRPMVVVAPDERYSKLIAVMTVMRKETFSADDFHYTMWSIMVRNLIDIILVCKEN